MRARAARAAVGPRAPERALLACAALQPSRARRRDDAARCLPGPTIAAAPRAAAAAVVARAASASSYSSSEVPAPTPQRRAPSSSSSSPSAASPHLPWLDAYPLPPHIRAPNVLSFEPRAGPHGGRHWVPPERHSEFLDAYAAWWEARAREADGLEEEGEEEKTTAEKSAGSENDADQSATESAAAAADDQDDEGPAVARPLTLAEAYGVEPYRYFQEFDLDWSLDGGLVLRLVDALCEVVADEAGAAFGADGGDAGLTGGGGGSGGSSSSPPPPPATAAAAAPPPRRFVVSMRTPYKVHLNFPHVVTNEARARAVRLRVTARLRTSLGGTDESVGEDDEAAAAALALAAAVAGGGENDDDDGDGAGPSSSTPPPPLRPPTPALASLARDIFAASAPSRHARWREQLAAVDWAAAVDAPHGSLRLPGSRKSAAQRDRDPAWVSSPRDKYYLPVAYGPWRRVRLTRELLGECSIRPTAEQLSRYEASPGYLEGLYLDARLRRAARRAAKARRRARDEARRVAAERALVEDEERQARARAAEERYRAALAGIGGVGSGGGGNGAAAETASKKPAPLRPQRPPQPPSPPPPPPSPPPKNDARARRKTK